MEFNDFLFSPVGFLCCLLLSLLVVIHLVYVWRRIDEAQKALDKENQICHCCKQRIFK